MNFKALEERVYRHRCVEALVDGDSVDRRAARRRPRTRSQPTAGGEVRRVHDAPAAERDAGPAIAPCSTGRTSKACGMDEAMHPLTLMVVGLYGKVLPNQNGAPLRVHIPVEVRLQERQVDRAHPVHRQAAADDVGDVGAERVRVLRQRESDRAASALEPGARACGCRGSSRTRRRRCSTATPIRSRASTPAWTSARTTDHGRAARGAAVASAIARRFSSRAIFYPPSSSACLAPGRAARASPAICVLTGADP